MDHDQCPCFCYQISLSKIVFRHKLVLLTSLSLFTRSRQTKTLFTKQSQVIVGERLIWMIHRPQSALSTLVCSEEVLFTLRISGLSRVAGTLKTLHLQRVLLISGLQVLEEIFWVHDQDGVARRRLSGRKSPALWRDQPGDVVAEKANFFLTAQPLTSQVHWETVQAVPHPRPAPAVPLRPGCPLSYQADNVTWVQAKGAISLKRPWGAGGVFSMSPRTLSECNFHHQPGRCASLYQAAERFAAMYGCSSDLSRSP